MIVTNLLLLGSSGRCCGVSKRAFLRFTGNCFEDSDSTRSGGWELQYSHFWPMWAAGLRASTFAIHQRCTSNSVGTMFPDRVVPSCTDDSLAIGQCNGPIDRRGAMIAVSYSTVVDVVSDLMSK